jgi:hypothetical protein
MLSTSRNITLAAMRGEVAFSKYRTNKEAMQTQQRRKPHKNAQNNANARKSCREVAFFENIVTDKNNS